MSVDQTRHITKQVGASTAGDAGASPCARSAACLVSLPGGDGLLLVAGDTGEAQRRLADVWRFDAAQARHGLHPWTQLMQDSSAGALEARSNAAAAVAGNHVAVFGGWQASGLAPLARLQVFDVEQRRWSSHSSGGSGGSSSSTSGTTASTAGSTSAALAFSKVEPANGGAADQLGITDGFKAISMNGHTSAAPGAEAGPELAQTAGHAAPCARGQPTLTATTDGGAMLLFGGWDGSQRFNDLWHLDTSTWRWTLLQPSGQLPPARADHVTAMWHYCDCGHWKDILVVHGGSSAAGLLGDVWTYDVDTNSWREAHCGGSAPCARSSHAAALLDGHLIISGGQAQGEVLSDLLLLQLSTLTWLPPPPLEPPLPPRCRHSLAVAAIPNSAATDVAAANGHDSSWSPATTAVSAAAPAVTSVLSSASGSQQALADDARLDAEGADAIEPQQQRRAAWLYGGFDGSTACSDVFQIVLPDSIGSTGQPNAEHSSTPQAAQPPKRVLSLDDMEDSVRVMPSWKQIKRLHAAAVEQQLDQYIDPASGYTVWTSLYLKERPCCGNACRHCPYGHKNVVKPP